MSCGFIKTGVYEIKLLTLCRFIPFIFPFCGAVASTVSGVASGGGSGATSTGSQSTGSATATGSSGSPTATNKSAASTLEVVSVLLFITFGATAFAL